MSSETRTSFAFTQRDSLPGAPGKLEERAGESRTAFDAARTGMASSLAHAVTRSPATSHPEPHLVLPDPRPSFAGPERRPVNDNSDVPTATPDLKAAFQAARQSAARHTPRIRKSR